MGVAEFIQLEARVEAIRYLPGRGASCNCAEVNEFTGAGADPCYSEDCSEYVWEFGDDGVAQPGEWIVKLGPVSFLAFSPEEFEARFAPVDAAVYE